MSASPAIRGSCFNAQCSRRKRNPNSQHCYRSDVAIIGQGIRNANDGLSELQIKDGALNNISNLQTRTSNAGPSPCDSCPEESTGRFDICWNGQEHLSRYNPATPCPSRPGLDLALTKSAP